MVPLMMVVLGLTAMIVSSQRLGLDKRGLDGRWVGPVCLAFAVADWRWGLAEAVLVAAFGFVLGIWIEWRRVEEFRDRVREVDATYSAVHVPGQVPNQAPVTAHRG